jgi:Tfp pilus assembly protein PilW
MPPLHSDRATRGLTLVEMIIGLGLGLVVTLAIGSVYLSSGRSYRVGARKLRAQQETSLLSTVISRRIRVASSYRIYQLPDRTAPADSGNGLTMLDAGGAPLARVEWDGVQQTLVDSLGQRVTALRLNQVQFSRDPALPRTVRYRFTADDEAGGLIEMESAAALRN